MIAPMKYVSVLVMKEDKDKILRAVRKSGVMMLCEGKDGAEHTGSVSASELRRMEKLIGGLGKYSKKSLFSQGGTEYDESIVDAPLDEAGEQAEYFEALLDEKEKLLTRNAKISASYGALLPWKTLETDVSRIGEGTYTESFTGSVQSSRLEELTGIAAENSAALEVVSEDGVLSYILVTALKDGDMEFLSEVGFERITIPVEKGKVCDEISGLEKEAQKISERLEEIEKELASKAGESDAPKLLYEKAAAAVSLENAPFSDTDLTVMLEGWVEEKSLDKLKKSLEASECVYALSARDPLEGEEVPTLLKNKKLVKNFEGITNMFNPPKYGEYDPNAVMAPWYWIIFGLMMGDAGYGLMMLVLVYAAKKIMRPKGGMEAIMNVILYSSIPTIVFGLIFGSVFGETVKIPGIFWFAPLENPVMMLVFTMVIGVIHIYTGMIVKIYLDIKDGRIWDALFDQVSWMLVITGLGMLFLPMISQSLAICSTIGTYMAIFGALVILFTAGRAKKGIFGKITGGLGGLYGITSYVSDILSYSRILALSLATGVVGMVMNLLAGMVASSIPLPVVKYIPAILIYVVGHVFNLALGLLSAYVHDCRLQYIEFYGKFYDGGGKLFKPFKVETKYIELKK